MSAAPLGDTVTFTYTVTNTSSVAAGPAIKAFNPYGTGYTGGVRVAGGDVNGDGRDDVITGAGPGAPGGHVKVFDGKTGAEIRSFLAFPGFTGGVTVAAGDVNSDGRDDIIVGAGPSGGSHVKVFDGKTGAELASFFAYGANYNGGVRVGAGDIDGDGRDDIITGTGTASTHVKVFSGRNFGELRSFLAFPGFTGGVTVAGGDVNGDGLDDIIVGAGPGSVGGHVKAFDGKSNALVRSFLAYPGFAGGVNVASGDVNGDGFDDIITGAGAGAANGHVKAFNGASGALLASFNAYSGFSGGVFVAAGDLDGDGRDDIITGAGPGTTSGASVGVWYLRNTNSPG